MATWGIEGMAVNTGRMLRVASVVALLATACMRSGFFGPALPDGSLLPDGGQADSSADDIAIVLDSGVRDALGAESTFDATLPPGTPPELMALSHVVPAGIKLHVFGGFNLVFNPLQGGVIDVWNDLTLDVNGQTNLSASNAYNHYGGLFFQRTKFGADWRPQGSDTNAHVELVATTPVRSVVWVQALLDDPSHDFVVDQIYSVTPVGRVWIDATFTSQTAAAPDEITYGLGVTNALPWEHATAVDDPLPLRVETAAPSFVLHRTAFGGDRVATMLVPITNRTGLDWIFGVYDLDNVQYIYYHQDGRSFEVGGQLRRTFALFVKPNDLADTASAHAHAADAWQPMVLSFAEGNAWPIGALDLPLSGGACQTLAGVNGLSAALPIAAQQRFEPLFRIGRWMNLDGSALVLLDGQVQVEGRDHRTALEPVARGYYVSTMVTVQIADGGDPVFSALESLNDVTDVFYASFEDDAAELLLGFAEPVSGLLVEVDPRGGVTSNCALGWEYRSAAGWQPLSAVANTAVRDLRDSGHLTFAVPADWVRWSYGASSPPLFYLRARRTNGLIADPPLAIRRLRSDVLDLQLYRILTRDLALIVSPGGA